MTLRTVPNVRHHVLPRESTAKEEVMQRNKNVGTQQLRKCYTQNTLSPEHPDGIREHSAPMTKGPIVEYTQIAQTPFHT